MNDLVELHFEAASVRIIMLAGVPWWVGLDATALLEITRGRQALAALDDYERGAYIIGTPGGPQETTIINESGLYSLILRSRKPVAKQFKRWLTTEVLPSIRKFGVYPPPPQIDLDLPQEEVTTPQQRFLAECRRIASEHGVTVAVLLKHIVSPSQLRAIEMGVGPIAKLLTRDQRWIAFMGIGMDLQFVLHGIWQQTPQERRLLSGIRSEGNRQTLLG